MSYMNEITPSSKAANGQVSNQDGSAMNAQNAYNGAYQGQNESASFNAISSSSRHDFHEDGTLDNMGAGEVTSAGANYYAGYGKAPDGMAAPNMMYEPNKSSFRENFSVHILMVGIVSLLLLIPSMFFSMVLDDRKSNEESAIDSIVSSWGDEVWVADPVLAIHNVYNNTGKKDKLEDKNLFIVPAHSQSSVTLDSEKRYRGIYEATVYTSKITQKGEIDINEAMVGSSYENDLRGDRNLNYQSFYLLLPISSSQSINKVDSFIVNGKPYKVVVNDQNFGQSGVGIQLYMGDFYNFLHTNNGKISYEISYTVLGSQSFKYAMLSTNGTVDMSGIGAVPSFSGAFLPKSRSIDADIKSFTAQYERGSISTGVAPIITSVKPNDLRNAIYKIDVKDEAKSYILISRLTKYVILVIVMTYITVLAFEIVLMRTVSLVQYVVIGAALVLFYMVLLSLSEHINFTISYVIGALLMSLMIGLYSSSVLRSYKHGFAIFLLLIAIYAVLYALVHIEAYALLVGTIILVIMMGLVMFITRRLNTEKVRYVRVHQNPNYCQGFTPAAAPTAHAATEAAATEAAAPAGAADPTAAAADTYTASRAQTPASQSTRDMSAPATNTESKVEPAAAQTSAEVANSDTASEKAPSSALDETHDAATVAPLAPVAPAAPATVAQGVSETAHQSESQAVKDEAPVNGDEAPNAQAPNAQTPNAQANAYMDAYKWQMQQMMEMQRMQMQQWQMMQMMSNPFMMQQMAKAQESLATGAETEASAQGDQVNDANAGTGASASLQDANSKGMNQPVMFAQGMMPPMMPMPFGPMGMMQGFMPPMPQGMMPNGMPQNMGSMPQMPQGMDSMPQSMMSNGMGAMPQMPQNP